MEPDLSCEPGNYTVQQNVWNPLAAVADRSLDGDCVWLSDCGGSCEKPAAAASLAKASRKLKEKIKILMIY